MNNYNESLFIQIQEKLNKGLKLNSAKKDLWNLFTMPKLNIFSEDIRSFEATLLHVVVSRKEAKEATYTRASLENNNLRHFIRFTWYILLRTENNLIISTTKLETLLQEKIIRDILIKLSQEGINIKLVIPNNTKEETISFIKGLKNAKYKKVSSIKFDFIVSDKDDYGFMMKKNNIYFFGFNCNSDKENDAIKLLNTFNKLY